MAYTFKKLSDVGQLNKPTEQTHVLVEDNSEIKKILVDNLGGGTVKSVNKLAPDENGNINIEFPSYTVNGTTADKNGNFEIEIPECAVKSVNGVEPDENGNIEIEVSGGASVQPDLNQNDPTAPDYVKNRTHYTEAGIKITWDGDTTNIETVVQEGLYLVSEETPSNDELKNSAIQVTIVDANGDILQKVDGSVSQIWEMLEAEGMITDDVAFLSYAAVVRKDNANIMGELVFPKAGTYFAKMPENDAIQFISMLDTGEKVKKIDSKFLPDFDPNTISHLLVGVQGQGENAEIYNDIEGNTASGNYSHAEGHDTHAIGNYSHAEGNSTKASGDQSHAEGNRTTTFGKSSHTEGEGTIAYADHSHAEGKGTKAQGVQSHAEGNGTTAYGDQSHAEGNGTIAIGQQSHVQGRYNIKDTEDRYAHIVGNGEDNENRSNAHTLDWYGNAWYANSVAAKYFVLESPDGSLFKITVDNSGTLSAEAMPE